MFIAVAYDISDDRRRKHLHKVLKNYIIPVQKSVFEGFLSNAQFSKMKQAVRRVIRPAEDQVRYYNLCEICQKKIQMTPSSTVTVDAETIII